MYTTHLGVYRRSIAVELGGFRPAFDGTQDYDFVLRLSERTDRIAHVPEPLYHWRAHASSTAGGDQAKPYAYTAQPGAIREYLRRRGIDAEVQHGAAPGLHRIVHRVAPETDVTLVALRRARRRPVRSCAVVGGAATPRLAGDRLGAVRAVARRHLRAAPRGHRRCPDHRPPDESCPHAGASAGGGRGARAHQAHAADADAAARSQPRLAQATGRIQRPSGDRRRRAGRAQRGRPDRRCRRRDSRRIAAAAAARPRCRRRPVRRDECGRDRRCPRDRDRDLPRARGTRSRSREVWRSSTTAYAPSATADCGPCSSRTLACARSAPTAPRTICHDCGSSANAFGTTHASDPYYNPRYLPRPRGFPRARRSDRDREGSHPDERDHRTGVSPFRGRRRSDRAGQPVPPRLRVGDRCAAPPDRAPTRRTSAVCGSDVGRRPPRPLPGTRHSGPRTGRRGRRR